ncbi:CopY/TcrY family copper transport repressor [Carnobacteriaceae bacterium zg-ZUI240]|nr:CopY/TcrY family copper transport repressor [Carnobacteriaceae bacterium zg-ZUI240]
MISTAEWQVMRTVWTNKTVTATQVHTLLSKEFEWSMSTIKTLLSRLVKKGYLTHEKQQREFVYRSCIDEMDVILQKQQELLALVCTTKHGELFERLLANATLSKTDAQQMIALLTKRLDTLDETVTCCCAKGQCICHV